MNQAADELKAKAMARHLIKSWITRDHDEFRSASMHIETRDPKLDSIRVLTMSALVLEAADFLLQLVGEDQARALTALAARNEVDELDYKLNDPQDTNGRNTP